MVRYRLFIHLGGYDPVPPERAHRRFVRELARFAATWSIEAAAGGVSVGPDEAAWPVRASGPNWSVETRVRLLRWDDVMAAERARPRWRRLLLGLRALADFAAGGALAGYFRHAWRYGLFFLYPPLLLALLAGAAGLAGWAVAAGTASAALGAATGAGAGAGLLAWAGPRLLLDHLLDDWIFSARYLRGGDPVLGPRLDRLAGALATEARGGPGAPDEIVVLGHSLGAVLAIDLIDRALAIAPGLGRGEVPLSLVTVGSSIPKIGLHRGAVSFRRALGRVAAADVPWTEYQALTDAMNFYKTDPVRLLGAGPSGPRIRTVRISRMLERSYYRRIKRDFFRVHNQFVSANDARYAYDYLMLACGPLPAALQAALTDGAAAGMAPDGSFADPEGAAGAPA